MTRTLLFAPETFNFAEVTRCVEVARRLPEFRCVFAGFSDRFVDPILQAGFEYRPLTPVLTDEEGDMALALDQGRGWKHPFTTSMVRERVASERALIRELRPEAVLIGTTLTQLISARAEGVPLYYAKPFAYSVPHMTQMRRTGFLPTGTAWQRFTDRSWAWFIRTVLSRVIPIPRSFTTVAKECGLDLPRSMVRFIDADVNLLASPPELIPDWCTLDDTHVAVGPLYAQLTLPIPDEVAGIRDAGRPVVLVAMGSSANRDLALQVLHDVSRADVMVLSPTRLYLSDEDIATLPGNVHVTDWLPVHELGALVDVAITHGGEGTVQTSCANGWPFIGIPLQFEQRYNVTRCVEFGNARLVTRKQAARTDWARAATWLLEDQATHRAAASMAELFRTQDGPGRCAAEIRSRLGS
ncbi:nucleotide disphospho-sugar-binding domain-containing protein [Arachnia propionica]|uniref:glycosyltransferase n=1 Tax=Arachnia propionica TaxID=1750 RepID=UPI001C8BC180|nr:nucleotide disphospho-sugar-binding domain-containing protein [Arachnia propionica]